MHERKPRMFAEGTEARAERDKIAAELEGVPSVKEPYTVATNIVKRRRGRPKGAKKVGGKGKKGEEKAAPMKPEDIKKAKEDFRKRFIKVRAIKKGSK